MLHIFSSYDHPSSITASLLISLPLLKARTEFLAEELHNNTQQPPVRFPQPDSLSIGLHVRVLIPAIILSTPQLTEIQENVSLLKTPRQWNQWDGDESLQRNIPPAWRWIKVFGLRWHEGRVAGKRARFVLVFYIIVCILPEDLGLRKRKSAHSWRAKNGKVITNKIRLFFSCESVDSTSYRPACIRQWHM